MSIFFTSDQHFFHARIIDHCQRPFSNVNEMNEEIIARFNLRVMMDDLTYHVGDFSMKDNVVAPILCRLNGKHILVSGNHDATHCIHKKWRKSVATYTEAGFQVVMPIEVDGKLQSPQMKLVVGGREVLLCHLPYQADERHGERYAEWRPKDEGLILLCGHVHQSWAVSGRQINVGVDVWKYSPVSEAEIIKLIEENNL